MAENESAMQLQLDKIFSKFDEKEEKLNEIPIKAELTTKKLLKQFAETDVFEKSEEFLEAFDELGKTMGHVYHTVIEIELQRQKIKQPTDILLTQQQDREKEMEQRVSPIVVQAAAQPAEESKGIGITGLLAERFKWARLKEMNDSNKTPIITTDRKPTDILDYCKDVLRESNRFYLYFLQARDTLYFFPDEKTRTFFKGEIRTFLGQLCNIVLGFTQAIVEYRKELVGLREVAYAQAITTLEQSRIMAAAGMKVSGPEPGDNLTELLKENLRRRQ